MNKTSIEWVKNPDGTQGYTWNPITGCLNHINGMCKGGNFPCYAYRLAHGRLRKRYLHGGEFSTNLSYSDRYRGGILDPFYPRFWPERLEELNPDVIAGQEKGIFVCDMSDLFGIGIPEEWTRQILSRIGGWPEHRFYLLTKQPQNLIKFSPFPDNCWVGVTATDYDSFIEACGILGALNHKDGTETYISFEPLLSWDSTPGFTLPWLNGKVDWVVIGAQTKPYRPPKLEWVQEIVEAADRVGVPVFLKDNLEPLLGNNFAPWAWGKTPLPDVFRGLRQEFPNERQD